MVAAVHSADRSGSDDESLDDEMSQNDVFLKTHLRKVPTD